MSEQSLRLAVVGIDVAPQRDLHGLLLLFGERQELDAFRACVHRYFNQRSSSDNLRLELTNDGDSVRFVLKLRLGSRNHDLVIDNVDSRVPSLMQSILADQRYYFVLTGISGDEILDPEKESDGSYFFKSDMYVNGTRVFCDKAGRWSASADPFTL